MGSETEMASGKHIAYHRVLESLDQPGCPVCNLTAEDVRKRMEWMLYEHVNDPDTRGRITASRGFCSEHGELFIELGHPLGVSLIYLDVISAVIKGVAPRARVRRRTGRAGAECPACDWAKASERQHLAVLVEYFDEEKLHGRLLQCRGFCVPHALKLLDLLPQPRQDIFGGVLMSQLAELSCELSEIVRKSDYRCDEPWGSEGDAWIRAVRKLSGK